MHLDLISNMPADTVQSFSCSSPNNFIESFLKENALSYHQQNLAKTHTVQNDSGHFIGFFTLFSDYIPIPKSKLKKEDWTVQSIIGKQMYPAIRIHAIGIDHAFQGNNHGKWLMYIALDICREISESVGVVFVSVESFTNTIDFYKKCGFTYLNRMSRDLHNMVLKIDDLKDNTTL
ncbi:GNAT family N-acetyltransferase [Salibacterium lacus]|uniref:GNAT family N-acetyltransferase n=1 Tax=Salibacterium lacus TaxID=1898109 RepID=A0ABW5T5H7_9BACI